MHGDGVKLNFIDIETYQHLFPQPDVGADQLAVIGLDHVENELELGVVQPQIL